MIFHKFSFLLNEEKYHHLVIMFHGLSHVNSTVNVCWCAVELHISATHHPNDFLLRPCYNKLMPPSTFGFQ